MKKKIFNATHIAGKLYSKNLALKVTGANSKNPNTSYISGTIDIATDDALTNIVSVHFTYVTAKTAKNVDNANYKILGAIMDGTYKTVMDNGADAATLVVVDSAIGLNEFFSSRTGTEELVSAKRNEGGFVRIVQEIDKDEKMRNTFDTDIIIYNVKHIDADEENDSPEKAVVQGYIMDFRQSFLPVEYSVFAPSAIDYFEGLDASKSNPVFTRVKGSQVSQTIIKRVEEEGAFATRVREYKNTKKDFVITWAAKEPYTIGADGDISPEEIKKGLADRETAIATIKKNQDEWKAKQSASTSAFSTGDSQDTFEF